MLIWIVLSAQMHDLHHAIITFLSQLVIKHEDAFTLVADSRSVVPALVTCLNLDTGMIWNDDGFGIDGVEVKFEQCVASC